MPAKKNSKTTPKRPQKITFHYIKSAQHRVVHVDGAFGAVTPKGFISMGLFSERFPFPTESTHSLIDDGSALKNEADEVKGKKGIVREIDVTAVLTPDLAKKIAEWLIQKATEAEKLVKLAQAPAKEGEEA